jgi:hypothetical protein
MKIKDLIKTLQQHDPEMEVVINNSYWMSTENPKIIKKYSPSEDIFKYDYNNGDDEPGEVFKYPFITLAE